MAAGMHLPLRLRGVRKSGRFQDRQCIDVRAQSYHRPVASAQQPDHARSADAFIHLTPEFAQFAGNEGRGFLLFERKLRTGVQMMAPTDEFGSKLVDA